MKLLAIAAVLCLIATNPPSKPDASSAKDTAQPTESAPKAPPANNEPKAAAHTEAPKASSPQWYTSSEWWLVIIAALTGAAIAYQAREMARTTEIMGKQVAIAKDALIASQRPRLSVKHIFVTPPADITQVGDCREWNIGCVVANIGGSRAEVIESNMTIRSLGVGSLKGLLPAIPLYEERYSFGKFVVQPGERREMDIALDTNTDGMKLRLSHAMATRVDSYGHPHSDTSPLICYGFFKYRDDSGVVRISGFGSQWNRIDMSFTRLENSDYNYED